MGGGELGLPGVALSLPAQRTEITELVVLVVLRLGLPAIGLAKEAAQREMDGLTPAGQTVLVYDRLNQVFVDLNLDRLQHGPTIPTAFQLRAGTMAAIEVPVGRVLDEQ